MPDEGVWLAYHGDWSGAAAFEDERAALRYAVEHGMMVAYAPWGAVFGPGCVVVEGLVGGP